MRAEDREAVLRALDIPDSVIENIVAGEMLKAMNVLHTATPPPAGAD